ncbi:MAG: hypothetical protein GVY26_08755 [Bacteroidetes bacterium]|jgi:hypothetical protein|nr:hypothetical protein [Bacteroidota bacterium]
MNIKFKSGTPGGSLDGLTLECSASYEPTGIRLTWKAASEKAEQKFVYRVLNRHNRDSAGQPPAPGELTASGELLIPDFLLSYQIHIECFDEADTSERLAVIVIEDIGDF